MRILARTLLLSLCILFASVAAHAATYYVTNDCSATIAATLNFSDSSTMPISVDGNTTTGFNIGSKTLVSMTINGQTVNFGQYQQPVTLPSLSKILVTVSSSGSSWEPYEIIDLVQKAEW